MHLHEISRLDDRHLRKKPILFQQRIRLHPWILHTDAHYAVRYRVSSTQSVVFEEERYNVRMENFKLHSHGNLDRNSCISRFFDIWIRREILTIIKHSLEKLPKITWRMHQASSFSSTIINLYNYYSCRSFRIQSNSSNAYFLHPSSGNPWSYRNSLLKRFKFERRVDGEIK